MAETVRAINLAGLPHGFTGRITHRRQGSPGQEPEADRAAAVHAILPGALLICARQVHSAEAVIATEPWSDAKAPQADAVVTGLRGVLVGVVTADCAPVLLADSEAGVVAAAHAGWRGAVGGIIETTVAAMEQCGAQPDRIAAAIGPAIAQESYEVGDDFREHFHAADERFFSSGLGGRFQFDLPAYVADRLRDAGIGNTVSLGIDTYAHPGRYHSFRYATHRNRPTSGRQFSAIGRP